MRKNSLERKEKHLPSNFFPSENLVDLFSQLTNWKQEGRDVLKGDEQEWSIKKITQSINDSVQELMRLSKDAKLGDLDKAAIDAVLDEYDIPRENNLRYSVNETLFTIILNAGTQGMWVDAKAMRLSDYLTDSGKFHPVQKISEDEFIKKYPKGTDFHDDKELEHAVNLRWAQIEERGIKQGMNEITQRRTKIEEWRGERKNDIFNPDYVSNPIVEDLEIYNKLLRNNEEERKKQLAQAEVRNAISSEKNSVPQQVMDIMRAQGTPKSAYNYEGINPLKSNDGAVQQEVFVRTFVLPTKENKFVISLLSKVEKTQKIYVEKPDTLGGAVLQSIDDINFQELITLAETHKNTTGKEDVSKAFTHQQIDTIINARKKIDELEEIVVKMTGVRLGLSEQFEDAFGKLH